MNLLHDRETVIVVCSGTRQDLRCVQHHFTHAGHRAQAVCRVFDRHLRMLSDKNQNQFIKLCFHSRCWGCPLLVGYKIKTSIQFCVLKKLQIEKSWSTQTESHTEPLQLYSSVLAQPLSQLSPDWPAVWTVVGGWRPQYALSPYDIMQMNCVGSSLQLVHRPHY